MQQLFTRFVNFFLFIHFIMKFENNEFLSQQKTRLIT